MSDNEKTLGAIIQTKETMSVSDLLLTGEIQAINARLTKLEAQLANNSKMTEELTVDVKDLISVFKNTKGFLTFLGAFGLAAKWIIGVGLAFAVIWNFISSIKSGQPPGLHL